MDAEQVGRMESSGGEPVARGMAFLLLSQAVFLVCGYFIHIYLARSLGPRDYGIFGFIIAVLTWMEIPVYGSSNLAVKYIQAWPDRFPTWSSLFFRAQCLITVAFFFPLAVFSVVIGLKSEKYGFLFLLAFLDLLFVGFYQLYLGCLNGFRLYARQATASIAYSLSKAGGISVLVYLGWRIRGALLGNVLSSIVGLLMGYLLFNTRCGSQCGGSLPGYGEGQERVSLTRLIRESLLFALVPLMVNFVLNLDLWIINFLRGGSEVGYYVSAGTLARTVFFLFSATFMATFPAIVSSFRLGVASERTRRLFSLSGDFFLAVTLPCALAVSVNGRQLVALFFGKDYLQAGPITSILGMAMAFLTVYVFLVYVLYAAGRYSKAVRMLVCTACLDMVFVPLLVLAWGLQGAALATTTVTFAGSLLAYLAIKRNLALSWGWRRIGMMFMLCCLCFLPLLFIPREGVLFAPLSLIAFLVYGLSLVRTGIIRKVDLRMAMRSIIPEWQNKSSN